MDRTGATARWRCWVVHAPPTGRGRRPKIVGRESLSGTPQTNGAASDEPRADKDCTLLPLRRTTYTRSAINYGTLLYDLLVLRTPYSKHKYLPGSEQLKVRGHPLLDTLGSSPQRGHNDEKRGRCSIDRFTSPPVLVPHSITPHPLR